MRESCNSVPGYTVLVVGMAVGVVVRGRIGGKTRDAEGGDGVNAV